MDKTENFITQPASLTDDLFGNTQWLQELSERLHLDASRYDGNTSGGVL